MEDPYLRLSSALRAVDPREIRLTGTLTKCDPKGRNWKTRCFVLRGRMLEYYKADKEGRWENGELKGTVDLSCCGFLEVKNKGGKFYQLSVGLTDTANTRAQLTARPLAAARRARSSGARRHLQAALRDVGRVPDMAGPSRPPPRPPRAG